MLLNIRYRFGLNESEEWYENVPLPSFGNEHLQLLGNSSAILDAIVEVMLLLGRVQSRVFQWSLSRGYRQPIFREGFNIRITVIFR